MAIPSIIYLLGAGYQNYMERNINHTHYAALPLPPPSPSLMVGMEEIEYSLRMLTYHSFYCWKERFLHLQQSGAIRKPSAACMTEIVRRVVHSLLSKIPL